jgi:hypothetical protein
VRRKEHLKPIDFKKLAQGFVNGIISHPLPLIFKLKLDHILAVWLKVDNKF